MDHFGSHREGPPTTNDTSEPETIGLILRQAAANPEATAVICGEEQLTYREFVERGCRLARHLRAQGVLPNTIVAVALDRSADQLVTAFAVLLAGGAYLPLDPSYPQARLAAMIADAAAPVLVTCAAIARSLPAAARATVLVDADADAVDRQPATAPELTANPDDLAYVIFTSGSTGRPKGAMNTRAALLSNLQWRQRTYQLCPADTVLQKTPVGFDVSLWECFWPLLAGARIAVARPGGHRDPRYLAEQIAEHQVTLVHFVPSLFRLFLETADLTLCGSLRQILVGGEALPAELAQSFFSSGLRAELDNLYGPAEAAIDVTRWRCRRDWAEPTIPIGHPISGVAIHLLDSDGVPVPDGTAGEIYIGGAQVGRGYLARPARTAESFVPDMFGAAAGARMYRTGDRGRLRADGSLEFIGRADDQFKLRGVRIEPGEVEAALAAQPGVKSCAVAVRGTGDAVALVGYIVGSAEPQHLRQALARTLPSAMIPSRFVRLAELPLSANGKLDRHALPEPDSARPGEAGRAGRAGRRRRPVSARRHGESDGGSPAACDEELLCWLFADLLGLDAVGPDDDFFELGGHSLLAMRLVNRLRPLLGCALAVDAVFEARSPRKLTKAVSRAPKTTAALRRMPRPDRIPLSPAQHRLWFLDRLGGDSATYNAPTVLEIHGDLNTVALEAALRDVFERHESLRTVFPDDDGVPYQLVLPTDRAFGGLPVEWPADVDEAIEQAARRPFDLSTDAPLRPRLFQRTRTENILLLTFNHIGNDGWSMQPFAHDLHEAYAAHVEGRPPDWDPLPVQYADYTLWQRDVLGSERDPASAISRQLRYWRSALKGAPAELQLPVDSPRPARASHRGEQVPLDIDPRTHEAILKLARSSNSTVFMVLQAVAATLLHRMGAGADLPIGAPIAGRADAALDGLVGFFVNTLALRTDASGDPTFAELLGRVRQTDLAAFRNQDAPFEQVVEAANPVRSLARHPLFQVMLVIEQADSHRFTLPGLRVTSARPHTGTTKFDLLFGFLEHYDDGGSAAGLSGRLEFACDLFRPESARLLAERFQVLLRSAVADPASRLSELGLFLDGERELVTTGWNGPVVEVGDLSLADRFQEQATLNPETLAVSAPDGELTYAELNEKANRLALTLSAEGIGPGSFVGVALPRGALLVVAFVAVLKAGAAYLPIDTALPRERVDFILDDARPAAVLTTQSQADVVGRHERLLVLDSPGLAERLNRSPSHNPTDTDRPSPLTCEAPAYVVYTSGTTGRPKGVVLPARVLINLTAYLSFAQPGHSGARVAQFASIGFDVAEKEMLGALLCGKTLCVVDDETRLDPAELVAWLERERITEFYATDLVITAVYQEAADRGTVLPALRHVSQGGEPLQLTTQKRAFHQQHRNVLLHSTYGPSESHMVTRVTLPADVAEWQTGAPPLGRAIWNVGVFVLDDRLEPAPIGVTGEVYIAGPCVGHGYLRRAALTGERFVACPFGTPGERMYRTGDLARRRADHSLEYVGRSDTQVKIHGVRIELGEVNAVVSRHPGIAQTATLARFDGSGGKHLVAYVVALPGSAPPTMDELRRHAAAALPQAVVPTAFVYVDALPLTANGKLDHRALPAPVHAANADREPRTAEERALCAAFAEVLELAQVGLDDDFFALGGHSLLIARLVNRVRAILHRELSVRAVFDAPTPGELVTHLGADVRRPPLTAMRPRRLGDPGPPRRCPPPGRPAWPPRAD